ncbi:MAG: ABC transporter ATP-binding protein [Cyclobacteriaceae bacterium]|jgi:lipoprotein-releasing system ATP-binding protein|nr:ABC transporter ATP-binding protein [Cyclobacteriaceae bacterium]MDH4297778.1 ABC transporter ATP-binding protein [Cyclobacteriaceae bacterium]MDH5248569.1 ABC transporter ATP-binding protein [Cyclobacteriaceae bacterium]
MNQVILEARHINKTFHDPVTVQILKDITFTVSKGEFVSMMGKSGCGKSTLLYILSTMDTDFDGDLFIDQQSVKGRNEPYLAHVRNEKIGFVFQFHYLWNEFTVLENVMLPGLKLNKYPAAEVEYQARERLRRLGIENLALKKAGQISGGEKQRAALARAMINDPLIIMGDEPTGNLDKKNSEIVFGLFKQMSQELNQTFLVVTHDPGFAEKTDRIIEMEDGRILGHNQRPLHSAKT